MRIAFAMHAYAPAIGGAERYAQGLAEAMASMGHDIHVLAPNRRSAEAFYEYGHAKAGATTEHLGGVTVHRIALNPPRPGSLRRMPTSGPIQTSRARSMWQRYATGVAEEVRQLAPDVTIALPHAFPNVAPALGAAHRGIAVYAPLLHEEDPAWRVETIADAVGQAHVVLALTEWEAARLSVSYGADPASTVIVPPGVTAPLLDDVESVRAAHPYFVSIGRRSRSKDLTAIAQAIDTLRGRGRTVQLVVIGPQIDLSVDRELEEFGDAVVLIGEVDEPIKWAYLKGAMASVSMSLHESFGITTVETWRMARPVVARRSPVSSELVADGANGYLVSDSASLVQRLDHLVDSPGTADRMGRAGLLTAQKFTWESSAESLLSALDTNPA